MPDIDDLTRDEFANLSDDERQRRDMCECGHSRAQHGQLGGPCGNSLCRGFEGGPTRPGTPACGRFTWSHLDLRPETVMDVPLQALEGSLLARGKGTIESVQVFTDEETAFAIANDKRTRFRKMANPATGRFRVRAFKRRFNVEGLAITIWVVVTRTKPRQS